MDDKRTHAIKAAIRESNSAHPNRFMGVRSLGAISVVVVTDAFEFSDIWSVVGRHSLALFALVRDWLASTEATSDFVTTET